MSGDLRVAALEDLLARVRRNAQEPRASMAPRAEPVAENGALSADGAGSLALELDPLSDAFGDPMQPISARASLPAVGTTVNRARTETAPTKPDERPPASARTPDLRPPDALPIQRRGTPPASVRGVTPRPPTPMPPAMLPSGDSSPLHDAVISHTASSPASGRIENGFGLVPPPPRRPSSLPDFIDEPTATGDPDEAEQLLLTEQEEVRARVQFPTPPVPRYPTPLPPPPPLTLREPPRSAVQRPVLELDDLDLSSVAPDADAESPSSSPEPTRPFGYDPQGEHERQSRDAIPFATESQSRSIASANELQLHPEVDSASTDRPPEGESAMELPPMSRGRLPDIEAIERGLMTPAESAAESPGRSAPDGQAGETKAAEDPLFDAPSFEDPPTQDGPSPSASVRPVEAPFDVPTVDVPAHEVAALAESEQASPADQPMIDIAPPARISSWAPGRAASPVEESAVIDKVQGRSHERDEQDEEERSPSSSRQVRDEVRPLDDQFDGFGPVGDSEPPPESGEVPSQRYGVGESPAAREPNLHRDAASDPPRGMPLFENPSTEDDARSGVVVARISSVPTANERSSGFPVSDPSDGSPPKPARVIIPTAASAHNVPSEDASLEPKPSPAAPSSVTTPVVPPPFVERPVAPEMVFRDRTLRGMAVTESASNEAFSAPSEADAMSGELYDSPSFEAGAADGGAAISRPSSALDDKTTEVQSIGRVDVFERSPVVASAPITAVAGARPDLESFGAIVDASIALGL